jgi:hypothetical protein
VNKGVVFVTGAAVVALVLACTRYSSPSTSVDGGEDMGGDLTADMRVSLGLCQPEEHTRWHYGPSGAIPTNWSRHRLTYPRRQCQNIEKCSVTPMNHPAFPRREDVWYYAPPAEVDL